MARITKLITFAAVGLAATGCVSSKEYKKVALERDQALAQLQQTQFEAAEARLEAETYRQQLAFVSELDSQQMTELSHANAELQWQLDQMNARYAEAIDLVHTTGAALPKPMVEQLTQFAQANSDLLSFDPERRLIRFTSDLTFDKGSTQLNAKGKAALAKLAKILNDESVQPYELMIAGHTDDLRVVRKATLEAGHKDNWYLSAHRAIAVGQELSKHKIASQRMAMVGYADTRPVASNTTEEGRRQNRRVEILILPTTVKQQVVSQPTAPLTASVEADTTPAFNK